MQPKLTKEEQKKNDDLYRAFGLKVRAYRRERNWEQEHLGKLIHLSRPTISNIERGSHSVFFHTMMDLAGAFGITLTELTDLTPAHAPRDL